MTILKSEFSMQLVKTYFVGFNFMLLYTFFAYIFVDILGLTAWRVALGSSIILLFLRFLINKYWVFKR